MDVETQTESSYAMMLVVCCFVHEFLNAKAGLQHHDKSIQTKCIRCPLKKTGLTKNSIHFGPSEKRWKCQ